MKAKKIKWIDKFTRYSVRKESHGYVDNHLMFIIEFDRERIKSLRFSNDVNIMPDKSFVDHKPKNLSRAKSMATMLLRRRVARLSKYLNDITE